MPYFIYCSYSDIEADIALHSASKSVFVLNKSDNFEARAAEFLLFCSVCRFVACALIKAPGSNTISPALSVARDGNLLSRIIKSKVFSSILPLTKTFKVLSVGRGIIATYS